MVVVQATVAGAYAPADTHDAAPDNAIGTATLKEAIRQATDAGDWDRLATLTQQIQALEQQQPSAAAPAAAGAQDRAPRPADEMAFIRAFGATDIVQTTLSRRSSRSQKRERGSGRLPTSIGVSSGDGWLPGTRCGKRSSRPRCCCRS